MLAFHEYELKTFSVETILCGNKMRGHKNLPSTEFQGHTFPSYLKLSL